MTIEIKEIRVRTTIVENNHKQELSMASIKTLKRDVVAELKIYISKNEKRKRER